MKEKRKFVLCVQELCKNSDGFGYFVDSERNIDFEVEGYPEFIQFDAFATAVEILGSDAISKVACGSLGVRICEAGVDVPFHSFSLCVGVSGDVRWVYDVPGCFVDCDGDTDVSEQADLDCDQEQYEDVSEINAGDMAEEIAEECEDASEADLAHLFGYGGYGLAVNDFCDYGDNGFYFI